MSRLLGVVAVALLLSVAWGQDKEKEGIVFKRGMFSSELGMMDAERDEYASHLAAQAANQLAAGEGKAEKAEKAGALRLLSMAKRLSPRNKRARSVDALVREGVKPKPEADAFTPVSLAQLLLTRGKLLLNEEGAENQWVGRAFVELAAELDPKNKQAVKEREEQTFDLGKFDWSVLGVGE